MARSPRNTRRSWPSRGSPLHGLHPRPPAVIAALFSTTATTVAGTLPAAGQVGLGRKRWTTALVVPALDALNAMAKQHGVNRCVIAEALLPPLRPLLVAGALKPAAAPVEPEPTTEPKRRKRLTKEEAAKLDEVLLEMIRRDLLTKEQLQRVAEACGQKVATVAKRASVLRKNAQPD